MEWFILLMPMIIQLIEQCQEDRSREDIEAGLNHPGTLEKWAMRKILRQEGYRRRELWRRVNQGMAELKAADREDIAALMADVPSLGA